jgi:hypothetical protein
MDPHAHAYIVVQSMHIYAFERSSPAAKAVVLTLDMFMFDMEPHALLVFYGDLAGARLGWAKVI